MTRRAYCELILRRLANGDVSDDFPIKIEEVSQWIEQGVAVAAMKNYTDNANIEIEYVSDSFYTTFKNLSLTKDSETGFFNTTVPAAPYGIPKGYDVASVNIEGQGILSNGLIRVNIQQLDYYLKLSLPPKAIFYWFEGKVLNLFSTWAILDGFKVRVRMASGGDSTDLSAELNIPSDYMGFVSDFVFQKLMPTLNIQQDNVNDGNK